ncbi:MAG: trehalose-6-phosphate synthase, partial [Thermomicrobiales bacterium]
MPDRASAAPTDSHADAPDSQQQSSSARPLIIASNRGPVTFSQRSSGAFDARKGSGGVVTAVTAVARERQPIWIAAAMTEGDRQRAAQAEETGESLIDFGDPPEFRLRFVVPTPECYHQYYNVISNPLLWFLQHYLWDTPRTPDITKEIWDAWRNGYVTVNRMFADEIVAAADAVDGGDPLIMLQDYHLYLTAGFVRERRPGARLQLFVHIPWPDPD